ncbi:MAG: Gfo/Idh/MocA family oxidoreductase [Chloroflexi bacterium]|nr:Gfo/Idh/MocA family oxidoreductase [Chloroflexota bacterium]
MPDKLKVGIVGCGFIAERRHIPAYLRLKKNVVLQAVCDQNENLARDTARRHHIPKAYSALSEMLAAESLDIVDICTPPQTHAQLAVPAIEHGCHVLMEKPMALKTADCDRMLSASQQKGVKVCVIHNTIFYPPFLKARQIVAEGGIGEFTGMRILLSDPRDEMLMRKDYWIHKLPGGLIGETGPHFVYMSLAFLHQVKSVDIYAKNFLEHPWAPFDEFRIELEGEKAVSSVTVSYTSNRHAACVDILGTEGILHLDLQSMLLIRHGGQESLKPIALTAHSLSTAAQIVRGVVANAFKVATGGVRLGQDIIIARFVDSILNNHEPPVTGEDARETVRVMEMIVDRLQQKY